MACVFISTNVNAGKILSNNVIPTKQREEGSRPAYKNAWPVVYSNRYPHILNWLRYLPEAGWASLDQAGITEKYLQ